MNLDIKREYPLGTRVNEEPLIYVFDDFITDEEINAVVEAARSQMQRAQVSFQEGGGESAGRTGSNCWVGQKHNATIAGLSKRVSELIGIPLKNAESLQVIHYGLNQEYQAHYDAWDQSSEAGQRCMARGGQRLVTCLLYFNDVEQGGGTAFPDIDLEVKAKKGRMVVFHNVQPGTNQKHKLSLHGGMPVEKGEKWACNFWFRERDYSMEAKKTPAKAGAGNKGKKSSLKPARKRGKGTNFKKRR